MPDEIKELDSSLEEIYLGASDDGRRRRGLLSDASSLAGMDKLRVVDCAETYLADLDFARELPSLQALNLWGIKERIDLFPLIGLQKLERLSLRSEEGIVGREAFLGLKSLKHLDFSDQKIQDLDQLGNLEQLESLNLVRCDRLTSLRGIEPLGSLIELGLRDLDVLCHAFALEEMSSLQSLKLEKLPKVGDLPSLVALGSLEEFTIDECGFWELPPLSETGKLKRFSMKQRTQFFDVSALEAARHSLNSLSVQGNFFDRGFLGELKELEQLSINTDRHRSLNMIGALSRLRKLSVSSQALQRLPDLSELCCLEQVGVSSMEMTDFAWVETCSSLKELFLGTRAVLERVPDFSKLTSLAGLQLDFGNNVLKADSLFPLKNLETLSVTAEGIDAHELLKGMPNLKKLTVGRQQYR